MGCDIGIYRKHDKTEDHITSVRYQRGLGDDLEGNMSDEIFDHEDVYADPENNCLDSDGTFIVDVAFKPNWKRIQERCYDYVRRHPQGYGFAAYRELIIACDFILSDIKNEYIMRIG